MQNMSAQSLRMAVVNAASTDPAFLDALAKDGAKAVAARFGEQPLKVRVNIESANELPILIPDKNEKLARSLERIVAQVGTRKPTRSEFEAMVIHKAWNDAGYLTKLRQDPQGTVNSTLQTYDASVPKGVSVKVFEEQPGECLVVIPRAEAETDADLSDAQLEAVAGGVVGIDDLIAGAIVGAIAGEVVHQIMN